MGIEQNDPARVKVTEEALSRIEGLRESEVPWGYRPFESAIGPDEGRVLDEHQDPTHPLRKGRIKPDALEIAEVTDEAEQQVIDPVVFKSVSRMDAGGE